MGNLRYDDVKSLEGQKAEFKDESGAVKTLTISEVNKSKFSAEGYDNFTLIFKGDESFQCTQGSFKVTLPSLGEQELFVTPNHQMECEAVVSQKI